MTHYAGLLELLVRHEVEFILIGGVAATLHGASRLTRDVDVVYSRSPANLARIVEALKNLSPYLRGAPPGLPFRWDERTFANTINLTLTTSLGDLDLLGEITGGGRYEDLRSSAIGVELAGFSCLCLGLDKLIDVKRAAGRPKDFEAIAELENLRDGCHED